MRLASTISGFRTSASIGTSGPLSDTISLLEQRGHKLVLKNYWGDAEVHRNRVAETNGWRIRRTQQWKGDGRPTR